MGAMVERVPFLRSLRGYRGADLWHDVVAGILITATAVPLGVGFAQAAGLPAIVGLYTSMAPLLVYGLFASSRHVKIGLDAAAAAMIGSVVVPMASIGGHLDEAALLGLTATLTLLTGVVLLLAGLLRVGFLAELLSLPLLVGYQAGIGLSVIIGQLPKMLGIADPGGNDLQRLARLAGSLASTHLPTLLLGAGSLAALLALRRWRPAFPAALAVLVVATTASAIAGFATHGIAVIGPLPSGLPAVTLPDLSLLGTEGPRLMGVAASLALVVASDVVVASRGFAVRGHYRVSANTDIGALGLAEIAGGLTGAVPASASYARTAIAERSHSRSQLSAVIGGLAMAGVVAWGTGLLAAVPLAVLGAICVDVCLTLVDVRRLARLWRQRWSDGAIAIGCGAAVLVADPLVAIGAAVAFTVLTLLVRVVRPDQSPMGRRPGVRGWFPLDDYEDASAGEMDTVVYDWNAPLVFANAQQFSDRVGALCRPGIAYVVVDCSAIADVDTSALAMLEQLIDELRGRGVELLLAAPTPAAMEQLRRARLPERLGFEPHVFLDIDTALAAIGRIKAPPGELRDKDGDGIFEYTTFTA